MMVLTLAGVYFALVGSVLLAVLTGAMLLLIPRICREWEGR